MDVHNGKDAEDIFWYSATYKKCSIGCVGDFWLIVNWTL